MGERNYQKKILPVTTTETLSVSLLPFSWLLWLDLLRAFPPRASADTDASTAWTEKSERGGKEKEEEEEEFFTPLVTIVCLYRRRRLLSLSLLSLRLHSPARPARRRRARPWPRTQSPGAAPVSARTTRPRRAAFRWRKEKKKKQWLLDLSLQGRVGKTKRFEE